MPQSTAWTASHWRSRPTWGPTNSRRRTSNPGKPACRRPPSTRLETSSSVPLPTGTRIRYSCVSPNSWMTLSPVWTPVRAPRSASTVMGFSKRTWSSVPPAKSMP